MTPKEFLDAMKKIHEEQRHEQRHDCEVMHGQMDDLMGKVLKELGYTEGVDYFDSVEKWYA
jgi:hypothetical protein